MAVVNQATTASRSDKVSVYLGAFGVRRTFIHLLCLAFLINLSSQLHEVFPDFDYLSDADLACDIVCLVYDVSNPYSFEYSAKVFKVKPCVCIARIISKDKCWPTWRFVKHLNHDRSSSAILHGQQDSMYDDRGEVGPARGQTDVRLQSSGVLQEAQDATSPVLHL